MTCTLLAVAGASVTGSAGAARAWAGVLLGRARRARVSRRTNGVCSLDPYVPFSHYSPQP
jgi:hypothetical protein